MNKSKIIGTIVGIVLFIAVISGLTYAYTVWSSQRMNLQVSSKCFNVLYEKGKDLSGSIIPSDDYTGGLYTSVRMNIDTTCNVNAKGRLYLNTGKDTSSNLFREGLLNYAVVRNKNNVIASGNITSSGEIAIDVGRLASTEYAFTEYKVYVWLDNDLVQNSDVNSVYYGSIRAEAAQMDGEFPELINLVTHVTTLYSDNKNKVVTNNNIEYQYAESVGLMNDRLGGTTTNYDAGNIRYYGANPNNYVDIGDVYEEDTMVNNWEEPLLQVGVPESMIPTTTKECQEFVQCDNLVPTFFPDAETCEVQIPSLIESFGFSTVEEACSVTNLKGKRKSLYRIIGVFKNVELSSGQKRDLIKVIRSDMLGVYSWDQSLSDINNGQGINEWSQADLMKLLNPGYSSEAVGGSLYWNSESGTCYTNSYSFDNEPTTISCDFTKTGLSRNAKNNIETVVWNLGGLSTSNAYANDIYGYERSDDVAIPGTTCQGNLCNDQITRKTTWNGNVTLAYVSDYVYATDFNNCNAGLNDYTTCANTNWMYNFIASNEHNGWLLNPGLDASNVWYVHNNGFVGTYYVSKAFGVFPVFYLDSELVIESGDGSKDNPYVIK